MKVKFNISNFHYAKKTRAADTNAVTYETPVHIPGAVSFKAEPQGENSQFYADGIVYYSSYANNGYEGEAELANIPDQFRQDILSEVIDQNKVLFENASEDSAEFACGFDIDTDGGRKVRIWYFNCKASRISSENKTVEEAKEPTTDTMTITCSPDENGYVRAKTTEETTKDVYDKWFQSVYVKSAEEAL